MSEDKLTSHRARILVVDDEPGTLQLLRSMLEVDAHDVETAGSGLEALERLQRNPMPELVLLDLLMPGLDGLETLKRARHAHPEIRVIMLSCVSEPRNVVQAIRLGAQDYLTKPFHKSDLDALLRHYLARPLDDSAPDTGAVVEDLGEDAYFVALSPAMRRIYAEIRHVADVGIPVLMLGETGTGKEVAARLIHKLSSRSSRMFYKVNCAALPSELLESELFGYEAGAFTGAIKPKPGKFELCNKGTILLDEIAEMPVSLQAKLLHVLQDQQFSRLGSRGSIQVDVRILAATNVDVQRSMTEGKLRRDLYYRLNTVVIHLPPLRERREEIPLLFKHFMVRFAALYGREPLPLSPEMLDTCLRFPWPGNLRELENFVKRYLILGEERVLWDLKRTASSAPCPETAEKTSEVSSNLKSLVRDLKGEAESEAIGRALERTNWSRKEAARLLNISYKTLLYKIRQYDLEHRRSPRLNPTGDQPV